ncbi:Beta-lactamase class A [Prochlorococcus sp. SS52]|nr:Beta-lactamase class A [Prochlorococcus marinus str. SS2]KGG24032.1 Beta-lactamase class A [Prochlorococcus marinus str. SS35]KGG34775.1 Beta-lactamase class A [Prochlorococcus sp. SS52]
MGILLRELIERFEKESRPDLHKKVSITWVCYKTQNPEPFSGIGAGWLENKLIYPASVVKLFYACAIETWLQKDLLVDSTEMRRAIADMIVNSSNDATSYIVDLLTATTSGPSLKGEGWEIWKKQRYLINDWIRSFNWSEFKSINCCQKTWGDGPFGRDSDFYGRNNNNRNALTTIGTARLFEALMTGILLTPKATNNLKRLLFRSLDLMTRKSNPDNQIDGFLGEGLIKGTKLWSKAGLMSEARHDAAWFITPQGMTMLLIVFSEGKTLAEDNFLLPAFANELRKWNIQEKTLST